MHFFTRSKLTTMKEAFLTIIVLIISQVDAISQSLLWKISGNGLASTSYLYGTIHIKDKRVFEWSDSVCNRIIQCDAFAPEIDLDAGNLLKAAKLMMLPQGTTLHDVFTEEEYKIVQQAVSECSGYQLSFFDQMKPYLLIGLCINKDMANDLDETVDEMLFHYAKSLNKKITSMETIEEQDSIMDMIPSSYVVEYFKNIDQQNQQLESMIQFYRYGQLDSLLVLMDKEESGTLLQDELIIFRNHRMANRLIPMIQKQSTFIAVGAGHLPGIEGLIELLRGEGFKVEPVLIFKLD
jgi:uncharacterized protein